VDADVRRTSGERIPDSPRNAYEVEVAMSHPAKSGPTRVNLLLLVAEECRRQREEAALARVEAVQFALTAEYFASHPGARPQSPPAREGE
jgi:hypothetical protein